MKISLFGGSGKTGRFVINQALANGHSLCILVRNKKNLAEYLGNESVTIVEGDATDLIAVSKTIANTDAVISTLGHKNSSPDMQTQAIKHIILCMKKHNLKRLVCLTGSGVFFPEDKPRVLDKLFAKLIGVLDPDRLHDAVIMCELIVSSTLDWTAVRTNLQISRISSKKLKATHVGESLLPCPASRNQIANFILDCVETNKYLKQAPVVSA